MFQRRGCWQPLLSGARGEQALAVVDAVADSLSQHVGAHDDPSLAGGQAGFALFYGYIAHAHGDPGAAALAQQCLDRAIAAMAAEVMDASLFGGFSGVAWAVELVDRLLDPGGEDRGADVDVALARLLARPRRWPAPHDLVTGVTGIGVYALARYPRPRAVECLGHLVARLRESARRDDDGVFWWTPAGMLNPEAREEFPGHADVGVAHGQAGAIGLLGALAATGVERTAVGGLLEEAVSWLWAQAIATATGPTFPYSVAPGLAPEPARSAWCYGDPGVAAALLAAARGAGRSDWEQEAVALACRAAGRPAAQSGVVDGCLCHGAAGLAHLYNRMFQATGELRLRDAALCWVDRTLEFCRAAQRGGDGWVLGSADPGQGPWSGLDLVNGAAGVGLALLAAATAVEPAWDGMFLLSGAEPGGGASGDGHP